METRSLYIILSVLSCNIHGFTSLENVKITEWNHKGLPEATFRLLFKKSLTSCKEECKNRRYCAALTYKRLSGVCELLNSTGSMSVTKGEESVFITRADIIAQETCNCGYQEVCDNDGSCNVQECAPLPNIANYTVLGNMNAIQSKLKILCNPGYKEINGHAHTTCTLNGTWQYIPACVLPECDKYLLETEPDSALSSSSHFPGPQHDDYKAKWARLNVIETINGNGGWSKYATDTSPWIQVRFSETRVVQGIVTQSRHPRAHIQFVTHYTVKFSRDCVTFYTVSTNLEGNTDAYDTVTNYFSGSVTALCIRLYPLTWTGWCSLRMEVIGCI